MTLLYAVSRWWHAGYTEMCYSREDGFGQGMCGVFCDV